MIKWSVQMGQQLAIVGSAPELGSWSAAQAVRMEWQPGHAWSVDVAFPVDRADTTIEYKVC